MPTRKKRKKTKRRLGDRVGRVYVGKGPLGNNEYFLVTDEKMADFYKVYTDDGGWMHFYDFCYILWYNRKDNTKTV